MCIRTSEKDRSIIIVNLCFELFYTTYQTNVFEEHFYGNCPIQPNEIGITQNLTFVEHMSAHKKCLSSTFVQFLILNNSKSNINSSFTFFLNESGQVIFLAGGFINDDRQITSDVEILSPGKNNDKTKFKKIYQFQYRK